jgi:hypothetical protein
MEDVVMGTSSAMPIASDVMEAQAANVLEEVEAHRRG